LFIKKINNKELLNFLKTSIFRQFKIEIKKIKTKKPLDNGKALISIKTYMKEITKA